MTDSTRIETIIAALTLDEKIQLLAGKDMWSTVAVERVGLPSVKVTDGPAGARGGFLPGTSPLSAVSVPCGSALGATWNPALIERIGALLGAETRTKTARVLLAPTINLHRSPLGGRNFECYSEDPLLTGATAAAFIRGAQSQGVATTVKHFVANDQEHERYTTSSEVDERTLRELYLVPFEMAIKDGGSLGIMTGYNRLNSVWCGENYWLLQTVLRDEWGFTGFVISDWFAIGSPAGSAIAGLDLEMPGPGRHTAGLGELVRNGELAEAVIDERVRKQLRVWEQVGALDDPIVPEPEQAVDLPEHRALAREAAADAIVLLTNDGILPLAIDAVTTIALLGPNALHPQIGGGGSAELKAHYRSNPVDAITALIGDRATVEYAPGCDITRTVTPSAFPMSARFFHGTDMAFANEPAHTMDLPTAELSVFGSVDHVGNTFSMLAAGVFTAEADGAHILSFVQSGRARVFFNEELIFDGITNPPPPGAEFFGLGSKELNIERDLEVGRSYPVRFEYSTEGSVILRAVKLGIRIADQSALMDEAVATAARSDVAVIVVGTNSQWETEGHDRDSMDLPGAQDELIRRVCAVNSRTIVVVNTGSPVTMDWADLPSAIVQSWFGGQEMGNAIADVLFGLSEPGGRLPTTIPIRLEHNPSYTNFPGDNRVVRYGEGVFIGYRWYEARHLPARFAFGHGLSYSSFEIGKPTLVRGHGVDAPATVTLTVTNTGDRAATEVVQIYVAPVNPHVVRPYKELKAFEKVHLAVGESKRLSIELPHRAFAYWDAANEQWDEIMQKQRTSNPFAPLVDDVRTEAGWYVDAGDYVVQIGTASNNIAHTITVTMPETRALPR